MQTDNKNIKEGLSPSSAQAELSGGLTTKCFYIKTFGCQMNSYDSECITGQLATAGYEQAENSEEADIILFNTCSVREHAAQRFYTNLGDTKKLREKKPDLIVGVCGCVAEQDGLKILERFPWVKLIAGPGNVSEIGKAVKKIIENDSRIIMIGNFDKADCKKNNSPNFLPKVGSLEERKLDGGVITSKKNISALVTVIRGCNNFCSYCVVPRLRGREQNRPGSEIIAEVKQAAREGYKEIMLLGQNVCAYNDFVKLLKEVNEIKGIERIKFMTSHPRDVDEELIEAVANLDKVCKEFHLPVQSGSDKILKEMNRGYTKEYYIELINSIRKKVPGIRITTDIIVGFPGENEEDFRETLDLVKKIKFDDAFTFKYSDRPGTKADKKDGKIPQEIKEKRLKILMEKIKISTPIVSLTVRDSKQEN